MCTDLLIKLAAAQMPCVEADPHTVDLLRVLVAARHIDALVPPAYIACDDRLRQEPATVYRITPEGWKAVYDGMPCKDLHACHPCKPKQPTRGLPQWLNLFGHFGTGHALRR
jgi:hypothetical protein